MEVC